MSPIPHPPVPTPLYIYLDEEYISGDEADLEEIDELDNIDIDEEDDIGLEEIDELYDVEDINDGAESYELQEDTLAVNEIGKTVPDTPTPRPQRNDEDDESPQPKRSRRNEEEQGDHGNVM